MGVIWLRTKIYKYNRNDEKVYLKEHKDKWYHIMEIKNADQYSYDYYMTMQKQKTHYGLAEYINRDNPLYKLVNVIDYSMYGVYLLFRCEGPIDEKDEASINLLKKYIEGQISDGAWENGIYLLDSFIGNKVEHYCVEDKIEQVVIHPYKYDEDMRELYIPGNFDTIKALIDDEYLAAFKKEAERLEK